MRCQRTEHGGTPQLISNGSDDFTLMELIVCDYLSKTETNLIHYLGYHVLTSSVIFHDSLYQKLFSGL